MSGWHKDSWSSSEDFGHGGVVPGSPHPPNMHAGIGCPAAADGVDRHLAQESQETRSCAVAQVDVGLVERNITQQLSQRQETVMGECGTKLSDGQKQRIDNARAFLGHVASYGGLCLRNLLGPEWRRCRVNAWRKRTTQDRSVREPQPDVCIRNGSRT